MKMVCAFMTLVMLFSLFPIGIQAQSSIFFTKLAAGHWDKELEKLESGYSSSDIVASHGGKKKPKKPKKPKKLESGYILSDIVT